MDYFDIVVDLPSDCRSTLHFRLLRLFFPYPLLHFPSDSSCPSTFAAHPSTSAADHPTFRPSRVNTKRKMNDTEPLVDALIGCKETGDSTV